MTEFQKGTNIDGLEKSLYKLDSSVKDHFTNKLNIQIERNGNIEKVPVIWMVGEKWKQVKNNLMLRDEAGSLILPIISIGGTGLNDDPNLNTLASLPKTERLEVKKELVPNDAGNTVEYISTTVAYPKQLTINYVVNIKTQFVKEMNQIIQKIISGQEYQQSFVVYDLDDSGFKYHAIIDTPMIDSKDNLAEVGQEERIVEKTYTFRITTPIIDKDSIRQERVITTWRIVESVE